MDNEWQINNNPDNVTIVHVRFLTTYSNVLFSCVKFLQRDLDSRISDQGVENAYFPLLIPKSFLSKEAEHVDGFAKECAVVTHHRLKDVGGELVPDPEAELEEVRNV